MVFENITKDELIQGMTDARAKDIIMLIKLLVSQVGKEKTKDLIRQAKWAPRYQSGREAAEKAGNPHDLDSYIDTYYGEEMPSKVPWIEPVEWRGRTKNKAICQYTSYCVGKALSKLGDEEIREIAKEAYCTHDIAWAAGFNPNIKMQIKGIYYDGDDCCEFVHEV